MPTHQNHSHPASQKAHDETTTRDQLAAAAKAYAWEKAITILEAHPELINVTRPGGKSLYTPLHQAANGNAPPAIIEQLLALGAQPKLRTAKNETALDIARRKSHHTIAQLLSQKLEKVEHDPSLYLPIEVSTAQTVCALRFQGYEYAESVKSSFNEVIKNLVLPIVENLVLHRLDSDNFAAFFGLQRYLHKWGGEQLTKQSKEHRAYDYLFLHLYTREPSATFCTAEYCERWQSVYAHQAEEIAGIVRRNLVLVGN